jgi:phosphoribosylformylglycinamidine synthase
VLRYVGKNPNGSRNNIAGISNKRGNVVGVMPHPEQSIETLTGPSDDGLAFFTSILKAMVSK